MSLNGKSHHDDNNKTFLVNTKVVTFITIILLFPNQFVIKWQGFFRVVNNEFIFYLDCIMIILLSLWIFLHYDEGGGLGEFVQHTQTHTHTHKNVLYAFLRV